jgi:hypothetical protein
VTPQVELLSADAANDEALVEELVSLINAAYAVAESGLWLGNRRRG